MSPTQTKTNARRTKTKVSASKREKETESLPNGTREPLRKRALRAAMEILRDQGWDAVTQQTVAEQSGVGRATVYRYWPDRTELVRDAVIADLIVVPHSAPTGVLRDDLKSELGYFRHRLVDVDNAKVLVALIDRAEWEHELLEVKLELTRQGMTPLRQVVMSAIADGSLRADLDPDLALANLTGPLIYRRLLRNEPIDETSIDGIIDIFLGGAASTRRSRVRRPTQAD